MAILCWILLGAIAAGGSVGYFLYRSNQDRLELIHQAQAAIADANSVKQESDRLMNEANKKLDEAKKATEQSKQAIEHLKQFQTNLVKAQALTKPSLKFWTTYVSLAMNLSISVPSTQQAEDLDQSLIVFDKSTRYNSTAPQPWLMLSPFDQKRFDQLQSSINTTTPVSWQVAGHLITGSRGSLTGTNSTLYVLRMEDVNNNATLIWARIDTALQETLVKQILSTLTFPS